MILNKKLKEIQKRAIKRMEKGFNWNYKGYEDRSEYFYGRENSE